MAATTPVRIRDSAINLRSYGLVGYDDRLTRGRSPVRFRVDVCITVPVAQRIRHLTTNQGIVGSNPTGDVFVKKHTN